MSAPRIFALTMSAFGLFALGCTTDTQIAGGAGVEQTETAAPQAEPTAVPEPTPAPEPTDTPQANTALSDLDEELVELGPTVFGQRGFGGRLTDEQLACALQSLAAQSDLLTRTLGADDPLTLAIDDQADLAIIAFDCAPDAFANDFVDGFNGASDVSLPPDVTECLIVAMGSDGPNRRDVVLGFAALGTESPVPLAAQDAVIETMVTCLPGNVFADAVVAQALGDPAFASALDLVCLESAFDGEVMRPLWSALVTNPGADFDALAPETTGPMLQAMFDCLSFGQIIAAEAAIADLTLSEETIDCIDDELVGLDILTALEGAGPPPGFTAALVECLSPAELAAIGGV